MNDLAKPWGTSVVGVPEPHDSNLEHLTGQAVYCDDIPEPSGCLHGALVLGPATPSRDLSIDAPDLIQLEGLSLGDHRFLSAADIPGENNAGPVVHDEPLLPSDETSYPHQPVGMVLCSDRDQARRVARGVSGQRTAIGADIFNHRRGGRGRAGPSRTAHSRQPFF